MIKGEPRGSPSVGDVSSSGGRGVCGSFNGKIYQEKQQSGVKAEQRPA